MGDSLFQRKPPAKKAATSPYDLIAGEIEHLKNRPLARYGTQPRRRMSLWLVTVAGCALAWLYLMDPILHSWYRGEAISDYLYLHNYGTGKDADELAASGILRPDEIVTLNRQHGSYQDSYATPQAAARQAQTIIAYVASVRQLHAGAYGNLDTLGRVRYSLFIRPGLYVPTSWDWLDPHIRE